MGKRLSDYFFDTYALHKIKEGDEKYKPYGAQTGVVTTKLNLMEMYYNYFVRQGKNAAEQAFSEFNGFCVGVNDETIKEAASLRAEIKTKTRKSNVSFVDCIGYILAKKLKIKFLTGDREFEGMDNVEFVK